ncbi:unnamed protein product, partial [Discosporangium mesarthrocarpum]
LVHLGTVVACVGLLVLLHAGYSTAHFKQFKVGAMEAVGRDAPPPDVYIETLVGFLVCAAGVLWSAGPFLPIKGAAGGGKVQDAAESTREFDAFHDRGRSPR